ncbi:hypothetical protein RUM44_002998 [Polyplax serrata]|uniref:Dipeptidase n=1 Tax=Polyplax serrata TaxID=468196 RepID=A0ABR1AZ25_POLSC
MQTTCISDLPDIAPAIATTGQTEGFYRGQNGSIRCNGRALRSRTSQIHQDSSSCSSKEDSLDDPKGSSTTSSMRGWWIGIFVSLICTSLALGIGFPFYLSSGRPRTHEERLLLVRKILRDVPLIDGRFQVLIIHVSLIHFYTYRNIQKHASGVATFEENEETTSVSQPQKEVKGKCKFYAIRAVQSYRERHNDLPWNIRKFVYNQILNFNFTSDLQKVEPWSRSNWSHTDLPRLRAGLMGAQFWSAYVPCEAQGLDAVQLTLDQVDVIRRLTDLYSEHLILVTTVKGVQEAHRSGKIASLIGIEGGHSLGNSLAVLRSLYNLGARYLTVTHSCDTAWKRHTIIMLRPSDGLLFETLNPETMEITSFEGACDLEDITNNHRNKLIHSRTFVSSQQKKFKLCRRAFDWFRAKRREKNFLGQESLFALLMMCLA